MCSLGSYCKSACTACQWADSQLYKNCSHLPRILSSNHIAPEHKCCFHDYCRAHCLSAEPVRRSADSHYYHLQAQKNCKSYVMQRLSTDICYWYGFLLASRPVDLGCILTKRVSYYISCILLQTENTSRSAFCLRTSHRLLYIHISILFLSSLT